MSSENRFEDSNPSLLNEALAAVRSHEPSEESLSGSRTRSWERIAAEAALLDREERPAPLATCQDFQGTFDDYRAGRLSEARRLLVEDHTHTCVGCRKALQPRVKLQSIRTGQTAPKVAPWWRSAIAAALAVSAGLAGWQAYGVFGPAPEGSRATVQSLKGTAYRIAGGVLEPLQSGDEIQEGEMVRTAPGAQAFFRLRDGSVVEANERAELSFLARRNNTTIDLDRGTVIVEAAKRRTGHLYVSMEGCLVSVTGTVFAVTRGSKGSRVSVVEGEVHVEASGKNSVLHPGDQVATSASLEPVSIEKEIAWSNNASAHLQLLRELTALKAKLETIRLPGLRYHSRLLDLAPVDSVLVVTAPNLGNALGDANRLFHEQLEASPALKSWWSSGHHSKDFQKVAESFEKISSYLGDEILVTVSGQLLGEAPVFLAEVSRQGLDQVLKPTLSEFLGSDAVAVGNELPRAKPGEMMAVLRQNKLVIATSMKDIDDVFVRAAGQSTPKFTATEFGQSVQAAIQQGTGILVAANLKVVVPNRVPALGQAAFGQMRYLIAEQKEVGRESQHSARLNFAGPREGIASWLAAPAPLGSLDFITPDATFAASAVFKKPDLMLDELLSFQPELRSYWAQLDQAAGIRLKNELAASFGGEISVAVDGPLIPLPWKVILEVTNVNSLQRSLETLAKSIGSNGSAVGACKLDKEAGGDRTYYTLRCGGDLNLPEVHYAYVEGFVVMTSSRALLVKTIDNRKSGQSLARSERFLSLLPRDAQANFSAMVYQNASDFLKGVGGTFAQGQGDKMELMVEQLKPMLVCAYAAADNIQVVSKSSAWDAVLSSIIGSVSRSDFTRIDQQKNAGTAKAAIAYR